LERGAEAFRVADLARVWVLADLFENESGLIRPGAAARVRYQGRVYPASVGDARFFDSASRTLKVRLDLDNSGLLLRPDMFVDVEFDVREPEGVSVPVDAVLDSGRRKTVFVSTGPGAFEPREVVAGARYGGRVQIVKGLQAGEDVVTSGLFLLDSESRLQLASAGADKAAPAKQVDPVCGMTVEVDKTTLRSVHEGKTYYFCSRNCKQEFDKNPANYTKKSKI
jgi:YHS domain-containing protein/multidrug efflux pump subunit AcrA (membrane-fusion protein)